MSTGISCTLYVDGERFADGQPTENPADPVALAGLTITWGRSSTVDQPDTSTCAFQVMDARGGRGFLDELHTGLSVDVTATGALYPDPTTGTFLNPNLDEAMAVPVILTSGRSTVTGGVLELDPKDAARRTSITFAPAPFEPAGENPAAWDDIPTTSPGQTWKISARIRTAPGGVAVIRPVLFTGPWSASAVVIDQPTTVPSTGDWADVDMSFEPDAPGAWVGLQVSVYPTGWRWVDVDPPETTWAEVDPSWTWQSMAATLIDTVDAYTPAAGVEREVLVFSGRITDLQAGWDDGTDAAIIDVTAQDFTADLANTRVGDEPWTVETMDARFQRILTLAGGIVTGTVAPELADTLVSYDDVDSQPAADLLRDLAQTVDGVMWSAAHQTTGPYVYVEDPAQRAPLAHLELVDGQVEIVTGGSIAGDATHVSACDILRDPVEWHQDVSDVTTRASIGWMEQGVDDDGKPQTTDRTVKLIDTGLEARYGQRGISVSTLLQAETDAQDVAERVLARTSQFGWRAEGLHIDDDTIETSGPAAVLMMLDLLDGTLRNGRPILLTDLPDWAPVADKLGVFLEGGTYSYDESAEVDEYGNALMTWQLDLTVSNASGTGQSLRWVDVDPTWTWAQVDPTITWLQLSGVGPAPEEALA